MTSGFYRILLFIFLVLSPLIALIDFAAVTVRMVDRPLAHPMLTSAMLLGIALQPISVVGLWRDRRWGRGVLIIAAVLCIPTCGMAMGPVIVLAATPFRLDEAKIEHRKVTTLGGDVESLGDEPDA